MHEKSIHLSLSFKYLKIQVIQIQETQTIKGVEITAYYAGHVLGAVMFAIKYKNASVVYTGDFQSKSDRHLGGAWIDKISPDLLMTETTYADKIREGRYSREREFLKTIQETLEEGGKVIIPVFAVGRAQEICILLETFWARTKNSFPIYFQSNWTMADYSKENYSLGNLMDKTNFYYKLFVNWQNEKIKKSLVNE